MSGWPCYCHLPLPPVSLCYQVRPPWLGPRPLCAYRLTKGGGSSWWYSRMPSGSHRWGDQAVPNAAPHFHTYRLPGWGLSPVSGQAKRWEEGLCGPTCMHVENGFHLSLLPPAPRFEWYSLASLVRGQPDISRHHYCTKRALGSFLSLCPLLFPFGLGVKGPLSRVF